MAHIPVSRKGRAKWLPWVLLGLLAIAVIAWLAMRDGGRLPGNASADAALTQASASVSASAGASQGDTLRPAHAAFS